MEIDQPSSESGELEVGITPIIGGTNGFFLYDNNGILGEQSGMEALTIPKVTLSGGGNYEMGNTVVDVNLTWVCNKIMQTRLLSAPVPLIDRNQGAGKDGQYIHTGANLSTDTTYSITVGDGANTDTSSTTINFMWKFYYGTNSATSLNNAQILSLNGFLSEREDIFVSMDGLGEYLYLCYPTSWGALDIYVNGLLNTSWDLTVVTVMNVFGVSEQYNLIRSLDKQNGDNIIINLKT